MPAEAVLAALRALLVAIAPLKLPTALLGGLALAVWKHPRFTKDVDVLVALDDTSANQLMTQLAPAGFRPKRGDGMVKIGDLELLQLIYAPPDALVDVQVDLLLARSKYQLEALAHSVSVDIAGIDVPVGVLSCEDLILHKLMAGRVIDSADAAALLRANRGNLNWDYLKHWIDAQELQREFTQVWEEAFPGEACLIPADS